MFNLKTTLIILSLVLATGLLAQPVDVSLALDTNRVSVGATATLRAYAQIAPAFSAGADRVFSWYVDLLDSDLTIAQPDYSRLQRPASDNDPLLSSPGVTLGSNRRGIYDTFLNRPGAGKGAPVLLFTVPITGLSPGRATFRLQAGTTVEGLSADFLVAPTDGGDAWLGGNYATASVQLEVIPADACQVRLTLSHLVLPGGSRQVTISFPVCPAYNHTVESLDNLATGSWQPLPGAPHNSGTVTDTPLTLTRFYRLRLTP